MAYNEKERAFYVLQATGSVYVLDLNGPLPVCPLYTCTFSSYNSKCTPYLVPLLSGGVLVVTRCWRRSAESPEDRGNGGGEVFGTSTSSRWT